MPTPADLTALATAASLAAEAADENGGDTRHYHEAAAEAHDRAADAHHAAGNHGVAMHHDRAADAHREADGSDGEAEARAYAARVAAQEAADRG